MQGNAQIKALQPLHLPPSHALFLPLQSVALGKGQDRRTAPAGSRSLSTSQPWHRGSKAPSHLPCPHPIPFPSRRTENNPSTAWQSGMQQPAALLHDSNSKHRRAEDSRSSLKTSPSAPVCPLVSQVMQPLYAAVCHCSDALCSVCLSCCRLRVPPSPRAGAAVCCRYS